jgi:hypothetical protein
MSAVSVIGKLIILALAAGAIIGLIILARKLQDHGSSGSGGGAAGDWSDDQKASFEKQLETYLQTQVAPPLDSGVATCVAKGIEAKYSYAQVNDPSGPMGDLTGLISGCLGDKGDWNESFKDGTEKLIEASSGNTYTSDCVKCIVDAMEKGNAPGDYMNMSAAAKLALANKLMAACNVCKT